MKKDYYELHANICSIFSSPIRLEILDILKERELTVTDLLQLMTISKTNLSQHLSLMRDRGILKSRREGQHIYYSVSNKKIIQASELMGEVLRELMDEQMAKLK